MNTNSYLRLLLTVFADNSTEFSEIVGDENAQTRFALLRGKNLHDEVPNDRKTLPRKQTKTRPSQLE